MNIKDKKNVSFSQAVDKVNFKDFEKQSFNLEKNNI